MKLVWVLLRKHVEDGSLAADPEALKVFLTLVGVPTLYDGDVDLVKQAVRQNVRGSYIQPLTCLQWAHLALMEKYPVHALCPHYAFFLCLRHDV